MDDSQVCGETRKTEFCQYCGTRGNNRVGLHANCTAYWQCNQNGSGKIETCGKNQVFKSTGDCTGDCVDSFEKYEIDSPPLCQCIGNFGYLTDCTKFWSCTKRLKMAELKSCPENHAFRIENTLQSCPPWNDMKEGNCVKADHC